MQEYLSACPYCAGTRLIIISKLRSHFVSCKICHACGPKGLNAAEASSLWNRLAKEHQQARKQETRQLINQLNTLYSYHH